MLNFDGINAPSGSVGCFHQVGPHQSSRHYGKGELDPSSPEPSFPSRRGKSPGVDEGPNRGYSVITTTALSAYPLLMYFSLVLRSFDLFSLFQYNKGFQKSRLLLRICYHYIVT